MINVTKTYLPPIDDYKDQLERIWNNEWLTNRGELVLELEDKLKSYLSIDNILITNNGTIPLQIALKLLGNTGEIITTPFSYVATSSSIVWENCNPVYVDIHPEYLTIDEDKIEEAITENTTAILATHVFGNPCNIERIEEIAKRRNLKVIYDAAHCFGVNYNERSIFKYGDISTCSFHATKLFHTGEGGAVFCGNEELAHKIYYSHNFGHNGQLDFFGLGINGKISELQAAMGLAVLPNMSSILEQRRLIIDQYREELDLENLQLLKIRDNTEWNFSYFPVIFNSEETLFDVLEALKSEDIFPRRYFYPSLNTINYISGGSMPISESTASRIICLPLYAGLSSQEVSRISSIINSKLKTPGNGLSK